jgi:NAD(P)-dependent dehydrogenase (short-subunit alcohol dehydrogenase family)
MVHGGSNGKVALITGANKGLGFEMSRQLAQQGFTEISVGDVRSSVGRA